MYWIFFYVDIYAIFASISSYCFLFVVKTNEKYSVLLNMNNIIIKLLLPCLLFLLANDLEAEAVLPVIKMYGDFGKEYAKGRFIVYEGLDKTDTFEIYAKYRGASSLNYEKRSYAIKLVDSNGNKLDTSLFGLRKDNNWILDAMAVDKARMRNRVAFDIWNSMNVKPYYSNKEPKARLGIDGRFVELYLNDAYWGIYNLSEKMDRKQLKLKKMKDGEVRGVLYKGFDWYGTCFDDDPEEYFNDSSIYQGFEAKYPDVDEDGFTDWEPLVEKEEFVIDSTDEEFVAEYASHFDVPVIMDLHILMNVISAMDNRGKNQFYYIYDITKDKKMSFAPWDMDSSFGRSWNAKELESSYDGVYFYSPYYVNRMINLDESFMKNVAKRYFDLRNNILSVDSIKSRFDNYWLMFEKAGASQREYSKWGGKKEIDLDFENEKKFIYEFLDYRLTYLDQYYGSFEESSGVKPCVMTKIHDDVIYDVWGRKVNNPQIGTVYVRNGKLFNFTR